MGNTWELIQNLTNINGHAAALFASTKEYRSWTGTFQGDREAERRAAGQMRKWRPDETGFSEHKKCSFEAQFFIHQVLKEYEKTISELIADKERDKKALEAEVGQATRIIIIINLTFASRWQKCSRRRIRRWRTYRWIECFGYLEHFALRLGTAFTFYHSLVKRPLYFLLCRMWRQPLQMCTENMREQSRSSS